MPANKATHFTLDLTFKQLQEQGCISGANKEKYEIVDPVIASALYVQMVYEDSDAKMK